MQEEIRFAICPELTVSMLLCAYMKDDEAIILTGAERFSNYKVLSFRWVLCATVLLMTGAGLYYYRATPFSLNSAVLTWM